jgi:hypothetical protein
MIVVKLEMWPHGSEMHKRPLGEIRIANIGGDQHIGHYSAQLMKSAEYAKTPGVWRAGRVLNFRRTVHGPYDLLLRALVACIGGRSVEAVRKIPEDQLLFDPPSRESEVA